MSQNRIIRFYKVTDHHNGPRDIGEVLFASFKGAKEYAEDLVRQDKRFDPGFLRAETWGQPGSDRQGWLVGPVIGDGNNEEFRIHYYIIKRDCLELRP